jgi:hypothetical protein
VEKADHNLSLIHLPRLDLVPWLIFLAMAMKRKALSLTYPKFRISQRSRACSKFGRGLSVQGFDALG